MALVSQVRPMKHILRGVIAICELMVSTRNYLKLGMDSLAVRLYLCSYDLQISNIRCKIEVLHPLSVFALIAGGNLQDLYIEYFQQLFHWILRCSHFA